MEENSFWNNFCIPSHNFQAFFVLNTLIWGQRSSRAVILSEKEREKKRDGRRESFADLFFIEHGNLNKGDEEVGVAEFLIFLEGFKLVALVGFLPEEFDEDDDNAHVDPLHLEHESHGEANAHRHVQQLHDQRRLYHLPDHPHLHRHVEIHALD